MAKAGTGDGLLTIAKGTLALFGLDGYGLRTGVLSVPARVVQARGGRCCSDCRWREGLGVLLVSSGLGLSSTAALLASRSSGNAAGAPAAQRAAPYSDRDIG